MASAWGSSWAGAWGSAFGALLDVIAPSVTPIRHVPRMARLKIKPRILPTDLPDLEELFEPAQGGPVTAAGKAIRARSRRDEHFMLELTGWPAFRPVRVE